MNHTNTYTASDERNLFIKIWGEPVNAKACIVLVHGLGEHILRYEHLAQAALARGYCMIGYDQRGHGQTPGKRGVIGSPKRLMDDLTEIIGYAQSLCPEKPVFLYGHSMGALEVLYYTLRYQPKINAVIATSPPLDNATASKAQRVLVGALKRVLPNLAVPSQLSTSALSRDPEIVKAYINDPLVHDKVSVALGGFLIDAAEYVLAHASDWKLPLYLAHGDADAICPYNGSKQFMNGLKPDAPVSFVTVEGAYHETHNEPGKESSIAERLDWLDKQVEQS